MKIKRWIDHGFLTAGDRLIITNTDRLMEWAGGLMDSPELFGSNVFGRVVFEGEDERFYIVELEAVIEEIHPDYLIQILKETEEE